MDARLIYNICSVYLWVRHMYLRTVFREFICAKFPWTDHSRFALDLLFEPGHLSVQCSGGGARQFRLGCGLGPDPLQLGARLFQLLLQLLVPVLYGRVLLLGCDGRGQRQVSGQAETCHDSCERSS